MNELTTHPEPVRVPAVNPGRYVRALVILIVLLAGYIGFRAWSPQLPAQPEVKTEIISPVTLEARYGMRINLIAVTGGGGLIDFRFKVLDQEKAKQLLASPADMPILMAEEKGVILEPPAVEPEEIELETTASISSFTPTPNARLTPVRLYRCPWAESASTYRGPISCGGIL